MTTTEALEKARALAEEAHCRYCDFAGQDDRLKCKRDVKDNANQIAAALKRAYADGVLAGQSMYKTDASTKFKHIRAEADKIEKGHASVYDRAKRTPTQG